MERWMPLPPHEGGHFINSDISVRSSAAACAEASRAASSWLRAPDAFASRFHLRRLGETTIQRFVVTRPTASASGARFPPITFLKDVAGVGERGAGCTATARGTRRHRDSSRTACNRGSGFKRPKSQLRGAQPPARPYEARASHQLRGGDPRRRDHLHRHAAADREAGGVRREATDRWWAYTPASSRPSHRRQEAFMARPEANRRGHLRLRMGIDKPECVRHSYSLPASSRPTTSRRARRAATVSRPLHPAALPADRGLQSSSSRTRLRRRGLQAVLKALADGCTSRRGLPRGGPSRCCRCARRANARPAGFPADRGTGGPLEWTG